MEIHTERIKKHPTNIQALSHTLRYLVLQTKVCIIISDI